MVILGLGSNIGDRIANLRLALTKLRSLSNVNVCQVSPVYLSDAQLPENAPSSWNQDFLNVAIACETTLAPEELLDQIKKIEKELGRDNSLHWSPRVIDIDILAWEDCAINTSSLTIPHPRLLERPWALWPLADIAPFAVIQGKTAAEHIAAFGSRFSGNAPFHTRQIPHRIDTPELVGIINITPNSFSDGGRFMDPEHAITQAKELIKAGATVIDIGAESTEFSATPLEEETEWSRLEPVLASLQSIKSEFFIPPKISVDTRHANIAEKAFGFDIDWINDVSGLTDKTMQSVIVNSSVDCVIMHHLTIPTSRKHVLPLDQNPFDVVFEWGVKQIALLEKAGINKNRIIFDPGIGFGKTSEQSFYLLQKAPEFHKLGVRVLIGHSRKSFLSLFTDKAASDRDVETLAATLFMAKLPIDYLRVHNVEMSARAIKITNALCHPRASHGPLPIGRGTVQHAVTSNMDGLPNFKLP